MAAESDGSFSAVWIASAVQPGNAPLCGAVRYAPPSSRWSVSPALHPAGRLGEYRSGTSTHTSTHTSGIPHPSCSPPARG